ncbi:MAG: peptidoglycan DD-metalloendopeptidase family protein [Hydrogenophilales bacterium]
MFFFSILSNLCLADVSQDLENVNKEIKNLKKEISSKIEGKRKVQRKFNKFSKNIDKLNTNLKNLSIKLTDLEKSVFSLESSKKNLEIEIEESLKILFDIHIAQKKINKISYFQLLNKDLTPNDKRRYVFYSKFLTSLSTQKINELNSKILDSKKNIKKINDNIEVNKKKITKNKSSKKKLLNNLKVEKNKLVSLEKEIKKSSANLEKLIIDQKKLSALIKKLSKKRITNKNLPSPEISGIKFSKLKGKLSLPIIGKIMNSYGDRRLGTKLKWKGVFLSSKTNSFIHSIADGIIIFNDELGSYGNMLIIDHGEEFMSLYGNISEFLLPSGVNVVSGQRIAITGKSGIFESNGLYFELRYKGKTINPINWVK